MARFVVGRIVSFILSLVGASLLIFTIMALLGGDVATLLLGDGATPENLATLRAQLGLDRPLYEQYLNWVGGLISGDLGTSIGTGNEIGPRLRQRMSLTLPLAVVSLICAIVGGVVLGLVSAVRRDSLVGRAANVVSQVGVSIPAFWTGLLLALYFGVRLGWLPAGGYVEPSESVVGAIRSLILPSIALSVISGAVLARYVRAAILDVLAEEYMILARSLGLTELQAIRRHGLRNAAVPVVTVIGLQFGYLVGGAVVIESVFYLPGVGRMVIEAVAARDTIVVQSVVMILTAIVLTLNLATDFVYGVIDPRIRAGGRAGDEFVLGADRSA